MRKSDGPVKAAPRRRRLPKRKRHNKLRYQNSSLEVDEDHALLHSPPLPGCATCEKIHTGVAPAYKVPEEDKKKTTRPRERVAIDTVHADEEDIDGCISLFVTRDDKSGYPKCMPGRDFEARTALLKYRTMWPGSVRSGTFPENTFSDNGPEFGAEFSSGVAAAGGSHTTTVPRRPQSHASIERFILELEKGIATSLSHARAPYRLWSYAARHWCFRVGCDP